MIIPSAIASQAPAASSSTSSTTSNSGLPTSQSLDGMFLQLLVAQLQNQDPTQPLDPSTFVGQLAQFSELSEVTQIEQMLQNTIGGLSGTGTSSPSAASRATLNPAASSSNSSAANNMAANSPAAALSQMFTGSTIAPGNVAIPLGSTAVPAINFSSAAAAAQAALPNLSSPAQSLLTHRIEGVF